ncbi:MAG: hypothetical protein ACRD4S_01690 [Candidatus Acidiferrales bacterium]
MSDKPKKGDGISPKAREARKNNIVAFNDSRDGKPALKHGCQTASVQRDGRVPDGIPNAEAINREVDSLVRQIIADFGGESEISANIRTVIAAQRTCLLVLSLAGQYIATEGLINRKSGRPHALLSILGTFINATRLNAVSLGLERRAKNVTPTLEQYLRSRAEDVTEQTESDDSTVKP